jgi:hypothetical protein
MLQFACPRMRRVLEYVRAGGVHMRRRASGWGRGASSGREPPRGPHRGSCAGVYEVHRNLTLHHLRRPKTYTYPLGHSTCKSSEPTARPHSLRHAVDSSSAPSGMRG